MRQRVALDTGEHAAPVGPDHNAADVARYERSHRSDRVQVIAGIGEERAGAAVEATALDEQRLVAVIERCPRLPPRPGSPGTVQPSDACAVARHSVTSSRAPLK